MSFKDAFTKIVRDTNLEEAEIYKTLDLIDAHADLFTLQPTNRDEFSSQLISVLCNVIVYHAKCLYGATETNFMSGAELGSDLTIKDYTKLGMSLDEAESKLIRSRVSTLTKDANTFAIFISSMCVTWEDLFYDLCHECLHLLNPTKDISKVDVQRLEEGVAVKFAEDMYRKYITPYCNITPLNSPITSRDPRAKHSQYYKAHSITSKIPGDKLREVRSEFSSFWSVKDKDKFMSIVGDSITNEEADYLLSKFDYYSL